MTQNNKSISLSTNTQTSQSLRILDGRWKLFILFQLLDKEVMRFSELKRAIPGITPRVLSDHLKQLEIDGLILTKSQKEIPSRVEYSLTKWGYDFDPVKDALLIWAKKNPTE